MFNPDQVQKWRAIARNDPVAKTHYCDHFLGKILLTLGKTVISDKIERTEFGTMRCPSNVFGTPYNSECLNGIGNWTIHGSRPESFVVNNGRIIGNNTVVGDDGQFLTPSDVRRFSRDEFLKYTAWGHQGFLIDDSDDDLSIYFSQRQFPIFYDLKALFFHDLEPGNFGSFMFRQLPQLVLASQTDEVFDCYIASERTPYLVEAIEMLGLPQRPVFSAREIAGDCFKSITLHCVDDAEGFLPHPVRSALLSLVNKILTQHGAIASAPRKYVSRTLSALRRPWYRVMVNEAEIQDKLKRRGFDVIFPETLTLRDQIRVFANAQEIIGPSGSGMFNVMFSTGIQRVLDIETHHVTVRQHAKLYASCGADYSFLFSPFLENKLSDPVISPSICPIALLDEALTWLTG